MPEKINSIQRTMKVLTHICYQKKGVRVSEIARTFNTSSPNIHNYLKSLEKEGFIRKDAETGRFKATYRVLDLGSAVQANNSISEIAYPEMVHLSDEIESTIHLAIVEGVKGICISKVEKPDSMPSITRVGMSFDLYATALGKAIMAWWTPLKIDQYLEEIPLEPYTRATLTERALLIADLSLTKDRKFSIDKGEHKDGLYAVAVPVFNHVNEPIAAISTPILPDISGEKLQYLVSGLNSYAMRISTSLGYRHDEEQHIF